MSEANCAELAIPGERFCGVHLEELRRIRAEFEEESRSKTRTERKPTCQRPDCANPRIPPNPLCSECAEDTVDELAA
jgi:hypothetical protein